jgi:hypothetical protein
MPGKINYAYFARSHSSLIFRFAFINRFFFRIVSSVYYGEKAFGFPSKSGFCLQAVFLDFFLQECFQICIFSNGGGLLPAQFGILDMRFCPDPVILQLFQADVLQLVVQRDGKLKKSFPSQ